MSMSITQVKRMHWLETQLRDLELNESVRESLQIEFDELHAELKMPPYGEQHDDPNDRPRALLLAQRY